MMPDDADRTTPPDVAPEPPAATTDKDALASQENPAEVAPDDVMLRKVPEGMDPLPVDQIPADADTSALADATLGDLVDANTRKELFETGDPTLASDDAGTPLDTPEETEARQNMDPANRE